MTVLNKTQNYTFKCFRVLEFDFFNDLFLHPPDKHIHKKLLKEGSVHLALTGFQILSGLNPLNIRQ